jgi:iron complex outermembrane recepter protein
MEVGNRIRQNSFATLDTELSFEPASMKGLRLVVSGKNLTDKAYLASLLQTDFADGVSYAEPRTFGVRAEFSF